MNIKFINITKSIAIYKNQIDRFIKLLDSEKRYFNLTTERVLNSSFVHLVMDGNKLIGVSGLEKKYGTTRSYIMIAKEYQGRGLGRQVAIKKFSDAKKNHSMVLGIVEENNTMAFKLNFSLEYKMVGKRGNLYYLIKPLNIRGHIMFYFIKIFFPIVRVIDLVRR